MTQWAAERGLFWERWVVSHTLRASVNQHRLLQACRHLQSVHESLQIKARLG